MTLDEWCRLTSTERNEHRRTWSTPSDEYYQECQQLLVEARDAFVREYGHHPLIYAVRTWNWTGHKYIPTPCRTYFEPTIAVVTALYAPQRIEELPDRYKTFAIVQDQMEADKKATIRIWRNVAREVFDWTEQRLEPLISRHMDGLCGRDPWFYHEPPMYYLVPFVIPVELYPAIGTRYGDLCVALQNFIEGSNIYGDEDSQTDWAAIRHKVHEILSRVVPKKCKSGKDGIADRPPHTT